jgi:hypothetical protein
MLIFVDGQWKIILFIGVYGSMTVIKNYAIKYEFRKMNIQAFFKYQHSNRSYYYCDVYHHRRLHKLFSWFAEVFYLKRKLHNEELNDLYCSPNIVRVINSIRIRWAEHVAAFQLLHDSGR